MPVMADTSFVDSLTESLQAMLETLRRGLAGFGESLSFEQLCARLDPPLKDLSKIVVDFAECIGDVKVKPFLVPEGQQPGPDQFTLEGFAAAVVAQLQPARMPQTMKAFGDVTEAQNLVVDQPGLLAGAAAGAAGAQNLAGLITNMLRKLSPVLDPELFIRFAANIGGKVSAPQAAEKLAGELIKNMEVAAEAWITEWPADVPTDDNDKEKQEPDIAIPEKLGRIVDNLVARLPGASPPPADAARVGRDVHRAVMASYAESHRERLVINDGQVKVAALKGEPLRVSRVFSLAGQEVLDPDMHVPKVIAFGEAMRDPTSKRRVQPDIADLDPRAVGLNDDWGWFEIKSMANVRRGIEEIYGYYLPLWNKFVKQDELICTAGVWQPVTIFVTPNHHYAFAAFTVFPGAIGYLSYQLKRDAMLASVVGLATLADLFARRMITSLRRATRDAFVAGAAVAEFVLAWSAILVATFVLAWAAIGVLEAASVAALAAPLAFLIGRLAPVLGQLIPAN